MALSKSFEDLFINPDLKSDELDNKLLECARTGKVKNIAKHLKKAKELYFEEQLIYRAIYTFTLGNIDEEEKKQTLRNLYNIEWVREIGVSKSGILIKTDCGEIRVDKLTDILLSLKKDPKIQADDRLGHCHEMSKAISMELGDIENYVVTGYVYSYSDVSKYLHSWVELELNGESVVFDYTLNAMVNKDGYYRLQHVRELNRISNEQIREDSKKLKHLGNIDLKEYLVFRDEIMADLNKNGQLFDESR